MEEEQEQEEQEEEVIAFSILNKKSGGRIAAIARAFFN